MSFFHVWICILGTIYVFDKVIDTLLKIVMLGTDKNEIPEHVKSMYSQKTFHFSSTPFDTTIFFALICIVNVA